MGVDILAPVFHWKQMHKNDFCQWTIYDVTAHMVKCGFCRIKK